MSGGADNVVIIGTGQAAIQTAHNLRTWGHKGSITMIGEEQWPAYQRPPLSKAYMKGELAEEKLFLKPRAFYDNKAINLVTGVRVESIDRKKGIVTCNDGNSHAWDKLVIATGTRPRTLPSLENMDGLYALRGIEDARAIREKLPYIKHLTVLGGGYIGLETAAVVRKMGIEVVVLEMMPRLLARVAGNETAEYFMRLHKENGVKICCNAETREFVAKDGRISKLVLADGREIETDMLLLGIGVLPNMDIAEAADLECENGIIVNEDAQTSDPDIYAIGDCSLRPLEGQEKHVRLESVPNAIDQGNIVAAHITGRDRPTFSVPWFWSDQYETKIQTAGLLSGYDETVVRGEDEKGKLSVFYFAKGRFVAVDAINDPQAFMAGKQILSGGLPLTRDHLGEAGVSIMDIFKRLKQESIKK